MAQRLAQPQGPSSVPSRKQAWWCTPATPPSGGSGKRIREFKDAFGYIVGQPGLHGRLISIKIPQPCVRCRPFRSFPALSAPILTEKLQSCTWCSHGISASKKLRQEDCLELGPSLSYRA